MSQHKATVSWKSDNDTFLQGKFTRVHTWAFDGGAVVSASASPSVVPAPYSSTVGTGVHDAAHFIRSASDRSFSFESAGAHLTKTRSWSPTASKVSPPRTFCQTTATDRGEVARRTASGTAISCAGRRATNTRPASHTRGPIVSEAKQAELWAVAWSRVSL